jgi:outer membrane protein TolC
MKSFVGTIVCGVFLCFSHPPSVWAQESAAPPILTVDQAVQIALAGNRDLKIAELTVESSKWQVASTKTNRLPAISTYLLGSGSLTSPTFLFKKGSLGKVGGLPVPESDSRIPLSSGMTGYALAQALQPLSQLYKISLSIYEQELATANDNEQLRSQRQSVVANVKQDYYSLLQTQSSIDDTNAYIKQYEETERVTDQYLAQEAVLKSDSLTVKAQLAQYRYQLVELNNTLQTQKEQLNDLLGRNLDTDFRTEPVPAMSFEELDLKYAQQRALTQRPEIRQAEIGLKKADTDRKLAKAQYIPDISASIHYFTPINTELLPTNIATAGLEMSWDPWDWGRRRDDLKQKVIGVSQAQFQLEKARSQVLLDVNNNFRKLSQSRQMLSVTQAAKDAANEKLRETNDKFSKEAVLLRDVLQQQTAVANANKDYENALLSFWSAKANFEKALGQE